MSAPLGYFWGDDGYSLERAAVDVGVRAGAAMGSDAPLERWRTTGADTTPASILERVATATMFGGGTLAIVSDPMPLIRSKPGLDALREVLGAVAPGNALVFIDAMEKPPSRAKGLEGSRAALRTAIKDAGGETREFRAPDGATMPRWIEDRARELGVRLGRGAGAELARRVGALARGSDIDRRYQGRVAVGELEKLALLRVDGSEVTMEDVQALVAEAIPSSAWEFLDAFGDRRSRPVLDQLDLVLRTTPEPLLVTLLHTRLRQLLEVTDRIAAGEDPRDIVKATRINPYVAEKLARMSPRWTLPELRDALDGLFALDVLVKGADGGTSTEEGRRLAMTIWMTETLAGR